VGSARAARLDRVRYLMNPSQDLAHGKAGAGAEIEAAGRSLLQQLQRGDVRCGKIGNMDVVAHRGPVGSVVVVAEHGEVDMALQRHHRNEMRLLVTQFADAAGRSAPLALERGRYANRYRPRLLWPG
jgi:hypothetical protein